MSTQRDLSGIEVRSRSSAQGKSATRFAALAASRHAPSHVGHEPAVKAYDDTDTQSVIAKALAASLQEQHKQGQRKKKASRSDISLNSAPTVGARWSTGPSRGSEAPGSIAVTSSLATGRRRGPRARSVDFSSNTNDASSHGGASSHVRSRSVDNRPSAPPSEVRLGAFATSLRGLALSEAMIAPGGAPIISMTPHQEARLIKGEISITMRRLTDMKDVLQRLVSDLGNARKALVAKTESVSALQNHMDTLLSSISQLLQALLGSSAGAGIAESVTSSFPGLARATLLKSVLDPSFGQAGSASYENEEAMKSFISDKLARLDLILPSKALTKADDGKIAFAPVTTTPQQPSTLMSPTLSPPETSQPRPPLRPPVSSHPLFSSRGAVPDDGGSAKASFELSSPPIPPLPARPPEHKPFALSESTLAKLPQDLVAARLELMDRLSKLKGVGDSSGQGDVLEPIESGTVIDEGVGDKMSSASFDPSRPHTPDDEPASKAMFLTSVPLGYAGVSAGRQPTFYEPTAAPTQDVKPLLSLGDVLASKVDPPRHPRLATVADMY